MISVICPVYNESKYIEGILKFFTSSNPANKELIIIDGNSSDNTVEIIKEWQKKFSNIFLLKNPDKYVPFALNLAIKNCKGDPIVRIDAHTKYAPDYFEKILETFNNSDADIVGGPYRIAYHSDFQEAVGVAISSKFGTGDSLVHNKNYSGYIDSVAYGAWKKNIFEEIGYFDERLLRNQDDEFHYRAKSLGKKIYQNQEIKLWYYPRNSFKSLAKQYFQYGLFKPLVLSKIKSEIKLRHLIPSLFFLYILSAVFLSYNYPFILYSLSFYLMINIWFSFKNNRKIKIKLLLLIIFPLIHLTYGTGFLFGISKLFKKK